MIKINDKNKEMVIFGLSSNQPLTEKICKLLNIEQSKIKIDKFADGEIITTALDSVRNKEVYIVQSTSSPVNDNLMELLITIDALRRASAKKINIVVPYFGYARQDRKASGRQPITAKLVANLIQTAGADRAIMVDLHSSQSMGFFDIPVDNFSTAQTLATEIIDIILREKFNPDSCILVSPDYGGTKRVHTIQKYIGNVVKTIAVIAKRRPEPNKSEVEFVLGDIKDKVCFIIDDMIDTGGTIINAAKALKANGAKEVYLLACHGLFNGNASQKISDAIKEKIVEEVIVTDTIHIEKDRLVDGIRVISVDKLIANMIEASYKNHSLTGVYRETQEQILKLINKNFKKVK
ncbi:ribose-phosphate pyrophosphokinase [Spiroplasma endosymbiont of Crioceris asparagi]|uniref:ribose-phosphate diphosphokinase n=1 Tax=Spiroplasma endosymbiont of Crioceris asparagi TaxID=3066286 RepID=UPI0030CC7745